MFELVPTLNYDLWYGMPEYDPVYYWDDDEDEAGGYEDTNSVVRVTVR